MTLRGVIRNGTIKLSRKTRLPNGTVVEVLLTPVPTKRPVQRAASSNGHSNGLHKPGKPRKARMTKQQRVDAALKVFKSWRERPDWKGKSSVEIAAELRRQALGGRLG